MRHPPNETAKHSTADFRSFCLGCTACLGCVEEADVDLRFNEKNVFGFQQKDWLDFSDGAQVLKFLGEVEVRVWLKKMQPDLATEVDDLSVELCAERLLLLGATAYKKSLEEARIRALEAERESFEMEERYRLQEKARVEAEKAERSFWAQTDKDYARSPVVLDWHTLHEERRSKASFRSMARWTQVEMNSERLHKRRLRQRTAGKREQLPDSRKMLNLQRLRMEVQLDADQAHYVW
jgi:hypothetical protein